MLAFLAFVLANCLPAQQGDSLVLADVVITGQYQAGSASQAVHRVQVITQEKIQAMGAQNLRDVLSNQLNVRLSQDNLLGSGMSLQGMSGQNVKVLIDGVAVIGRLDGNIDLSQLNLRDVERIEIVEGPLAVSYGSDALAGTVNIVTKKSQKREFSAEAQTYYESIGHYNLSGRVGLRKGKNIWSLSLGRNYFDGWRMDERAFSYVATAFADSRRFMDWKPKEQLMGRLYWGRYIGNLKLDYTGDGFWESILNRGYPRAPYLESAFDDRYRTQRMGHALRLGGAVGPSHQLALQAASNLYQRTKNTWFRDLTTLEAAPTNNPGDQDTTKVWDHSSRGTLSSTRAGARWNYELGYDGHLETAHGLRIADGLQRLAEIALFGSMESVPVKGLVLRPGLRYGYNSAYRAPLIPALNLKYSQGKLTLRASYARGFRAPSLKELYFDFQDINHDITGNPALRAELSHNFAASGILARDWKRSRLEIEAGLFQNSIRNLITLAQTTGNSFMYVNVGNFQTHGANLKAQWNAGGLVLSVGAGLTGRWNALPDSLDLRPYSYSPDVRASATYDWKQTGLKMALFYNFTGRLPGFAVGEDGELLARSTQAYHLLDASLSRKFWNGAIDLTLGAKNLLGVTQVGTTLGSGGVHSSGSGSLQVGTGRSAFIRLGILLESKK
ncbi:MAG TPA: TonB-dependent receptor [Bacteroidia bacterium]|nr:TonB-dependent receptor [Bacteroidia bacterium]